MGAPSRISRRRGALLAALACLATLGVAANSAWGGSGLPPRVEALLVLRHPGGLARFVRRVSNPRSPDYRDYLGVSRLVHRFGATHSTRRAVLRWLSDRGLDGEIGPTGTYALAGVPAPRGRRLLGASSSRGRSGLRTEGRVVAAGRVPHGLDDVVERVGLLSTRPGAFGSGSAHPVPSSPAASIPPLPPQHGSERDRTGTPAGCAAGRSAGFAAPDSAFTPN